MGNRIFWACQKIEVGDRVLLNDDGTNEPPADAAGITFTKLTAVQSIGMNTNLSYENIFQLGQLDIYQEYLDIPEIEVTINRLLNGKKTLYSALIGNGTLIDNLQTVSAVRLSLYEDKKTDDPLLGPPSTQYTLCPAYLSQITYTFPADGNFTEEATIVASNKTKTTESISDFSPADKEGKIFRRGSFNKGSSIFPSQVGNQKIQNVTVSINFNREQLRDLGKRKPVLRYINLPLEITTEIEVLATESGDGLVATTPADCDLNVTDNNAFQPIKLITCDGMTLDLGSKNKLMSTSFSGGDASGGNATVTYSFRNWNTLTYTGPTAL